MLTYLSSFTFILGIGAFSLIWMVARVSGFIPGPPTSAELLIVAAVGILLFAALGAVALASTSRQ